MKLRLPGRRDAAETTDTTSPAVPTETAAQQARTGGKGRPTPKRSEAQGRRPGPPPPPPTTRREAYRRMRQQQASRRVDARQAAARGDEAFLPARDRGPVRRTVRNVVDARRNIGSWFLAVAGIALILTFTPSEALRGYGSLLLFSFFVFVIIDSFVLGRKIKQTLAERFPDGTEKTRGAVWYGISRSTMIRRWRFPKPEVPIGADV
ncbi:DUF3043 domain-containing protein [Blastococcus sp. CCUG 61487]|uniref:DUF3043 domain-containing protein n=1 Tax=Blastococcus sp. CCUG 61487 TaxID=1840703 RepID=UPI0010BF869B|nr:DUF3043 domain-containing protein [Blastococcus sp. CCUG 61487]TKJ20416.1 hypothetical protein A6V29_08770 [Blastococcus sp. CCUG 61487]